MGVRQTWGARRRRLWEGRRRPLGIVVVCGGTEWSVGGGSRLWVLGGRSVRGRRSSFAGVGRRSWALGRYPWALGLCSWVLGCRLQAVGFVRVVGVSIAGGGVRARGRVVRACWFVVRGRGGDVSCAGWSSLARLDGMMGVLTLNDSMNNDERRHRRRSSFGCHVALSDVAPAAIPILLIPL